MDFEYYLAEALREHSPGAVATALEEKGCFGYDRFGRIIHLKGDSVEPALAAVEHFYKMHTYFLNVENNFENEEFLPSPAFNLVDTPDDTDYWQYGWVTKEDIPKFSDSNPMNKSSILDKPLETKERDNLYRMLIAMAIDGYGYDITAKTSVIPAQLELIFKDSFNFHYSSESISKHLRAARNLIELKKD